MKNYEELAERLVEKLTLKEKASLCSGENYWSTQTIKRLNIPGIMMTDGPHGLRKQVGESDNVGLNASVPATCFPPACTSCATWNKDLLHKMGNALGKECLTNNVSIILGPGVNMKRSPLCGRNFEYFSEDPYLAGKMAASLVNGIQETGVGTCVKHFAVNNQEKNRMTINSIVDERALHELYLRAFEIIVKEAQPWSIMCSYNRINSDYASDSKYLLTDVLRKDWGFNGCVITDWGACNDRAKGVESGLDLEMPSSNGMNDKRIVKAVKKGLLKESSLDKVCVRLLKMILHGYDNLKEEYSFNKEQHHNLAKSIADEAIVLLKNQDNILPLDKSLKVAVIGNMAESPRYQGTGSSLINPTKLTTALEEFDKLGINYTYSKGYSPATAKVDEKLLSEAVNNAKNSDVAILYVGLTQMYESEAFDRDHINMPDNHNILIEEVRKVNPNVVVVLSVGSPVAMPWIDNVKGVLNCYLGGQAGATSSVDALFGLINPSGKLAETFPLSLDDTPCNLYFPEGPHTVEYRESIFMGYRYYETAKKKVLFPFGYGLSYTQFKYSNLTVKAETFTVKDALVTATVDITNTGKTSGSEIVQLYITAPCDKIFMPALELKGFDKVFLTPGETKTVSFTLDYRSFAYYNVAIKDWATTNGNYIIKIGASCDDIRLEKAISVDLSEAMIPSNYNNLPTYFKLPQGAFKVSDEEFARLYGDTVPENKPDGEGITPLTTIYEIKDLPLGQKIYAKALESQNNVSGNEEQAIVSAKMLKSMMEDMPIRSNITMGDKYLSEYKINKIYRTLNRQQKQAKK